MNKLIALLFAALLPAALRAHPGKMDSSPPGCHYGASDYHCHMGVLAGQSYKNREYVSGYLDHLGRKHGPQVGNDLPPVEIVWTEEDEKRTQGRAKLERYYGGLGDECVKRSSTSCCRKSVRQMKRGSYREAVKGKCPEGERLDMLRCKDSFQWCVPAPAADRVKVIEVADGDTITVDKGGERVRIRFYGVDAPEMGQPYGEKAREFVAGMIEGQEVRLVPRDETSLGMMVAEVYIGESSLSSALVRAGLAWWYKQYAPKDKNLAQLEQEARAAKLGLWADQNSIPPWEWKEKAKLKD